MNRITNCPNCGAVLDEPRCKFCGSYVVDFADITLGSKDVIYIRINDTILATRCTELNLAIQEHERMYMSASFDGIARPVVLNARPDIKLDCKFVSLRGGRESWE